MRLLVIKLRLTRMTSSPTIGHDLAMVSIRRWCFGALLFVVLVQGSAVAPARAADKPAADGDAAQGTGDRWIDRQLADIDRYAERYPDSFLDEVSRYAAVRRGYVAALLRQQHWSPGDIYFACAWAHVVKQSCRELVRARTAAASWQSALQTLPVEPANLDYRAVRHAIVASYDRWERPIELDAILRRQLGDRAHRLSLARAQAGLDETVGKAER